MDCESGMVGREVKPAPKVSVSRLKVNSSVMSRIPGIAVLYLHAHEEHSV
jgi:hypothetical protein